MTPTPACIPHTVQFHMTAVPSGVRPPLLFCQQPVIMPCQHPILQLQQLQLPSLVWPTHSSRSCKKYLCSRQQPPRSRDPDPTACWSPLTPGDMTRTLPPCSPHALQLHVSYNWPTCNGGACGLRGGDVGVMSPAAMGAKGLPQAVGVPTGVSWGRALLPSGFCCLAQRQLVA